MNFDMIYFLGIGGIGMSNLARYFLSQGKIVAGYDRVETPLTTSLSEEGAQIHYEDDSSLIPSQFRDKENTLVIYTPAIPASHLEYNWFLDQGFEMMKRAQVLGIITKSSDAICVAGTHGKTTVSSMIAHLLRQSKIDCNAFLGGILKNYGTNLLLSDKSNITVIEADEYDRSFHWLQPCIAVITSADPDHLDIYGTPDAYRESFEHFTTLIRDEGYLLIRHGVPMTPKVQDGVKVFTYSESEGDFFAKNIRVQNGEIIFDFVSKEIEIDNINLGVPLRINIENAVVAIAVAIISGVSVEEIKSGIESFRGPKRRFDFLLKEDNIVFIDDYAHHPNELKASIMSIRELYPDKKVVGVFQPHLFSRTRDFSKEFAESLSLLENVVLLDIYPAREEPIEGVTSKIIYDEITSKQKSLIKKEDLIEYLESIDSDVIVTLGAGDIDKQLLDIREMLIKKYSLSV